MPLGNSICTLKIGFMLVAYLPFPTTTHPSYSVPWTQGMDSNLACVNGGGKEKDEPFVV